MSFRPIRLEDEKCPDCGSVVVTICETVERGEKYWFNCTAPNEKCRWGEDTAVQVSDSQRVSYNEAKEQFNQQFE